MPLSDHEKRLLDEIEQTLLVDDPALASSLRSARPQARTRTFVALALGGLVLGVALLIAALRVRGVVMPILGVLGYAAIVAGVDCALHVTRRVRAGRARGSRSASPDPSDA